LVAFFGELPVGAAQSVTAASFVIVALAVRVAVARLRAGQPRRS
jgi:hypothetical protein